jgi:uncharacterized protein YfbU (UPF0304 family)
MNPSPEIRWILANQYRLMELLESSEYVKKSHREAVEILMSGYELEYDRLTPSLLDPLPRAVCEEVHDILEMHSDVKSSYEKLEDKAAVENEHRLGFMGFDGSEEAKLYGYVRFLLQDLELWEDLDLRNRTVNSHMPMLDRYRRRYAVWKECRAAHEGELGRPPLTAEELNRIVAADYS